MDKMLFILMLLLAAGCAHASTNTNLVAAGYCLQLDTNGVIQAPSNFKTTNDIASASTSATAANLNTVSNMVSSLASNILSIAGSTGFVVRTGDYMLGNLIMRGSNVFTNIYYTAFSSRPLDLWTLDGFYHPDPWPNSLVAIDTNWAIAAFTNTGLSQATNVYRVRWNQSSVSGMENLEYTVRYALGDVTNDIIGFTSYEEMGAYAESAIFTGSWDRIIFVRAPTNGSALLINWFAVDQYGATLLVDADAITAVISPWFRYSTYVPTSSLAAASNCTISVSDTNVFLCLTTNSFGAGTNWITLQGRAF